VHYVTRKFPDALREFETVIARFPGSPKVADARLKIGFINYEMKQWGAARTALEQVTRDYPGSTSSKLASGRLDRMSKEGH
jgi:TolA-binding protein